MEMAIKMPNSPIPANAQDGGGSTRKKPHCSYCKNHKKKSSTRQHRCGYKEKCSCILCQLTRKAQLIMCHQQRVWRYRNQVLSDQPVIKGQKCDNCRNHSRYVKKSNHDCSFKHCDCRLCKLTFKRREIMKHIQRARRLGVTIESNIPDQTLDSESLDGCNEKQDSLTNGMAAICNDMDVEMLVSATNSVSVRCTSTSSVSPHIPQSCTDSPITQYSSSSSNPASSDLTNPPRLLAAANHEVLENITGERKKDVSTPCVCDLSSPDLKTSNFIPVKQREHGNDPRLKPRIFFPVNETPAVKGQVPDIPLNYPRPPEEDVKPLLLGPTFESQEPTSERIPRLGFCDPQCWANPPTLKLIHDFQPVSPFSGMNPYSSFEWGSYPSSHPMLYPSYIEPPSTRQTVLRPRPIIPNRSARSPFLFSSLFFRYPNATLQSLLPPSVREAGNTHMRSTDFLQAMYSRFPPPDPVPRGPPW